MHTSTRISIRKLNLQSLGQTQLNHECFAYIVDGMYLNEFVITPTNYHSSISWRPHTYIREQSGEHGWFGEVNHFRNPARATRFEQW